MGWPEQVSSEGKSADELLGGLVFSKRKAQRKDDPLFFRKLRHQDMKAGTFSGHLRPNQRMVSTVSKAVREGTKRASEKQSRSPQILQLGYPHLKTLIP